MQVYFLIVTLTFSLSAWSADVKKGSPTVIAKGGPEEAKALIHSIKLDDYLKRVGPEQILEKMDSAGKGNPDMFIVFNKSETGARQLVMQLFDINRDKKIDLVKHWEKGKMIKTELDLDYDGKVDVVSDYDTKTGELMKKTQADGSTNIWKHYFHNELRKKEVDRNSDGKPDLWVYYRGGKVIRTEIDQNFDGHASRVEGQLSPDKSKKSAAAPQDTSKSE